MIVEVAPRLYVGDEHGFRSTPTEDGWSIVHACKEPFHRAFVGYKGRGAPKGAEYLFAERGERLALNLVDVDNPAFVHRDLIERFLQWTEPRWRAGRRVLIHCNQGRSRSPSLGLLLMARSGHLPTSTLVDAEGAFRDLYPHYAPAGGVRGFLQSHWSALVPDASSP